jgi:outer membrane biosynthesis protein TonB
MVVRLQRRLGDAEEGRPLTRTRASNGHGNHGSPGNTGNNSVSVWKTLSFLLFVLLVLIVTETVEVKRPLVRDKDTQPSLGGTVQTKSDIPSLTNEEHNQMIPVEEPKQADPTSPPTLPQPSPTDPPTEVPQPAPSDPPTNPPTEAPKPEPTAPPSGQPTPEPTNPPTVEPPQQEEPQNIQPPPQDTTTPADLSTARKTERHTYQRRGQPMNEEDRKAMTDKWGQWTLVDDKERPTTDYYAAYPNRDIPRSAFPPNAWQIDTEYLSKFLPEAIQLVDRAIEAILAEYGKTEGEFKERAEMFELEVFDTLEKTSNYIITKPEWRKDETGERGGWSTFKSLEGLKRRLLHALMTEDIFIFALGGHSAAAGHGNLFNQAYTAQVQWIMEAIFARLGVRHQAKNFANGGMGTIQVSAINDLVGILEQLILMWLYLFSSMASRQTPYMVHLLTF